MCKRRSSIVSAEMCAPLAQTRDMGRIAAPGKNRLEASPGIEPGCKDLQSSA
jgi:hypothetical protein